MDPEEVIFRRIQDKELNEIMNKAKGEVTRIFMSNLGSIDSAIMLIAEYFEVPPQDVIVEVDSEKEKNGTIYTKVKVGALDWNSGEIEWVKFSFKNS